MRIFLVWQTSWGNSPLLQLFDSSLMHECRSSHSLRFQSLSIATPSAIVSLRVIWLSASDNWLADGLSFHRYSSTITWYSVFDIIYLRYGKSAGEVHRLSHLELQVLLLLGYSMTADQRLFFCTSNYIVQSFTACATLSLKKWGHELPNSSVLKPLSALFFCWDSSQPWFLHFGCTLCLQLLVQLLLIAWQLLSIS